MKKKQLLIWLSPVIIILMIVAYGFYEKDRKEQLYKDFRANKKIICDDIVVKKSNGWKIRNNRFFTNGKIIKTITFCKSSN
mgnify:FL=1